MTVVAYVIIIIIIIIIIIMIIIIINFINITTGYWDSMEEYTCMIPRETQEGAFYRAALALHQDHFQQAQAVGTDISL